ncbi:hypothetical protein OH76DRAFT_517330 [Lentinus brumalis]|uniref:Uncharacterized protein n=1 Tax=Lentinus brumalis TaxID=2498619 RepID=A0A371DAJ6_9APHY|nr:hypothetical protein OH76DRAFT_889773 [Polyporus brumalis]RDX49564.1 hypothetical protein OH76DRAFT_517330 [Polyporus brumalis]
MYKSSNCSYRRSGRQALAILLVLAARGPAMGKRRVFKGFSPLKKAAILLNAKKARSARQNKENLPTFPASSASSSAQASRTSHVPSTSPATQSPDDVLRQTLEATQAQLEVCQEKVSDYKREVYNTQRRAVRAQTSSTHLKRDLEGAFPFLCTPFHTLIASFNGH